MTRKHFFNHQLGLLKSFGLKFLLINLLEAGLPDGLFSKQKSQFV
jgi:hypothetical protein